MNLYNKTIRDIISDLDETRPYLMSSPTNGKQSELEGGVALNPYDEHYGDGNNLISGKVMNIITK